MRAINICDSCGSTNKSFFNKRYQMILCNMCRCEIQSHGNKLPTIYERPQYGEVRYSPEGKPICHICGKAYNKLLSHVWQRHGIMEKDYKKKFGLDLYKGIIAKSTKAKLQKSIEEHYGLVVKQNLIKAGKKTRFHTGMVGRTLDKISAQTMTRLKNIDWHGKFKGDQGNSLN